MSSDEPGTGSAPEDTHGGSVRALAAGMLRYGLPTGLATITVGAVISVIAVGLPGLWGALVGGSIGLLLSLLTILLMRQSADLPPMVVMAVAMGGFVVKMVVLLLMVVALKGVPELHTYALGMTLLASIIAWAAAEVVAFRRTQVPTLIP